MRDLNLPVVDCDWEQGRVRVKVMFQGFIGGGRLFIMRELKLPEIDCVQKQGKSR